MKKILFPLLALMLVLTGCSAEKSNDNKGSNQNVKSTNEKKSANSVNEEHLKEFTRTLYEANKPKEVEHLNELASDNVQGIIKRQFMSGNFEKSDRFDKGVSNVRLYKSTDDNNRYLATLEVKTRDKKEKKMIWLQKTIQYKIKKGKIDSLEEVGEREIFNEQD